MILTKKFVYVHLPKTGGTFVTGVIERLLNRNRARTLIGRMASRLHGYKHIDMNKHGTCREIPRPYRKLPIVTSVRNPYDRYVSQYLFGWWKDHRLPWIDWDGIQRDYPHFPDLEFEEFLEVASTRFQQLQGSFKGAEDRLGLNSEMIVRFFFREPEKVYSAINDEYITNGLFRKDLYPVHFLHTENLNQELHDFLLTVGFSPEDVGFILDEGRISPLGSRRGQNQTWLSFYTPKTKKLIRHRERLFFALFPEYDEV